MLDPSMMGPGGLDPGMLDPSMINPSMMEPARKKRSEMTPEEKAHDNHLTRLRKMATGKLPLRPGYAITPPMGHPQGISPRPAWAGSIGDMNMGQRPPAWMPKKPRYEMTSEEKRIDNKERKARETYKKVMRGEIPRPEGDIFPHTAPKLEMEAGMTNVDPFAETILTEDPFLEDPAIDPIGDPFSEPIDEIPADPNADDSGAATGMPGPERPLRKRRADMTPEERRASNQERKRREMYKKTKQAEQHMSLQQQLHQAGFVATEVPGRGCLVQAGPGGQPSWQAPLQGPRVVPAPGSAARVPLMGGNGHMRWPQPSGPINGFMGTPQPLAVPGSRKRKLRSNMTPEEKRADNADRRARASSKQAAQAAAAAAGGGPILPVEAEAAGITDGLTAPAQEPQWLA